MQGALPHCPASLNCYKETREMFGSIWENRRCPLPSHLQPLASLPTTQSKSGRHGRQAKHSPAALFAKGKIGTPQTAISTGLGKEFVAYFRE